MALDTLGDMPPAITTRIGEEDDLGLESLGLVQVHDPHHRRAARLERQRFDVPFSLGIGLQSASAASASVAPVSISLRGHGRRRGARSPASTPSGVVAASAR